jgi:hypothetical protein
MRYEIQRVSENLRVCYNSIVRRIILILTGVIVLEFTQGAGAGTINLQWDPVKGDPRVQGYEVHYGTSSAQYEWQVEANENGAATNSATISELLEGHTYYFAVMSYNRPAQMFSQYSNEVSATVPTCPCSLWDDATIPDLITYPDTSAVELGVKFQSDMDGLITGIRFYKSSGNTGPHVGSLWSSEGELLAQADFVNETPSGWQQVNFDTPVAIRANTIYVASYHTDVGQYSVDEDYFAALAYEKPPLRAVGEGENGSNGVYLYGLGGFPTETYNANNYWVDVIFTTK